MAGEYETAFKESLEVATAAMHKLQHHFDALEESTTKDGNRRQQQLAILALRSICCVAATPEGKHYGVYCDTVVRIIARYMKPTIGAKYWTMYLEHLRYLHHIIADKKLFKEASMLCDLIAGYENYLQTEGDYKIILGMYLQHLLCQNNHMRTNAELAQEHIVSILRALKELFIHMLQCNKEYNFTYPELITDFVQYLVPKRVSTVFTYLSTLPINKTLMYDAFFALLKGIHTVQPTKEELQAHCQRHLEALTVFFQLDIPDRLQQQLGLRHLRVCREMAVFANDKCANYVFTLLYYLVKLFYGLPNPGEFKDIYKDLSGKLTTFFERYGDTLMQERWFTDVPIVVAILLTHVQHHPTTPFTFFWQHMTSVECYIAHLDLIFSCIRLAPRIVETKLLKFDCCTSTRKHTIISLVVSSLAAYSSYAATITNDNESEELFISFRTQLLLVMRHGVSVLDSLECINPESPELKMVYARFVQLTVDMRTPAQIKLCMTLAEFLIRIRHKITIHDWTIFLRRLYKMTLQGYDAKLTADLHAAHIASMLQEHDWPDISALRSRIGYFHTSSPHIGPGECVLQLALQSHSPFKVFLDTKQKHLLHWLETQQFLKYHKSNEQLQITLMDCSPSHYSAVLVGRSTGYLLPTVAIRLRKLENEFDEKVEKTAGLTRVEYLCWAHVKTALLHDALKLQKEILKVDTKCQEDNLEELLQRKEFSSVRIAHELKLVNQAKAALHGFRLFYEMANSDPLIIIEISIDWEAIIEDLTSLALYLQLAGYTDLATQAWILHYRIANTINDDFSSLRSLSYFCEYSEYFMTLKNEMNLNVETARKESFLLNALQQLPILQKRFQNYILLYLCQLGRYHARNGHIVYAQILLKLVKQAHDELPNQQGKYNVVLGTVDVIKFRIMWKHLDGDESDINNQLMQRCLLRDMEDLLERFRGDFFKLSSSDVMSYTILLLSLVEQIAECSANRLCDQFVNSYFAGTFKLLLQSGSGLRLIQMLTMWTWINLQMEYVKKAQIKVKLIEYILGIKSLEVLRQITEQAAVEKKLKMPTTYTNTELLHSGMEPLRKMIPLHASPIQMVKMQLSPSIRGEGSLKRFLRVQCSETLKQFDVLEWSYFMVGCLNARLHFLVEDYENLEDFYESSQQWLQSYEQNKFLHISFQNIQLLSLQHYVNYLRMQQKYEKALNCLNIALVKCTTMRGNVDTVYRINFLLQQSALKIEMCTNKEKERRAGLRRALIFNVSPELNEQPEIGVVKATTVVTVAPASTQKKLTNPAFQIYGSNGNTPVSTATKSIASATKTVSKKENIALVSARKTKKKLAAEIEFQQTPAKTSTTNGRNGTKSLTARKLRAMRAAAATAGSSSSSSNSTPDTNILNQCQRIETMDLIDSDDSKEKENKMPNVVSKTNKSNAHKANKFDEGVLNICQKIESINLIEQDEPKLVWTTAKPKSQTLHEIIEIIDDTDCELKTPESMLGKLRAPPKTSNAKSTTKKGSCIPQSAPKSRSKKTANVLSTDGNSPVETTFVPNEPHIQVVEKIKITEDTKATTTKLKTRTKTEVRTLKVITKETETKIISPYAQTATKGKENAASGSKTRGRPGATRKRAGNGTEENITPSLTVSRTLSRRAKQ
ncbi:protein three rows [Eurosta solidaginis]|uniref:protein three rows n=1 Tax=Eurosta solidaginis TaxID=178769 RepID=UPI0035307FC5